LFAEEGGDFIYVLEKEDGNFGIGDDGLPEEGDVVYIGEGEPCVTEAFFDGFDGDAAVVFFSGEAFFFDGEDYFIVYYYCCC
jgi:hypothetical protein